jgi:hypothetical protein
LATVGDAVGVGEGERSHVEKRYNDVGVIVVPVLIAADFLEEGTTMSKLRSTPALLIHHGTTDRARVYHARSTKHRRQKHETMLDESGDGSGQRNRVRWWSRAQRVHM